MADEVKKGIRVHQALHGYADGHRLLASSTTLTARDKKTMLIMSDASGPGATIDSVGYLTGYPLADSGVYAVGRTWAAKEMPRPGCVWTHTLLLDFADLADLPFMDCFDAYFRQPQSGQLSKGYSEELIVDRGLGFSTRQTLDESSLRQFIGALYTYPKDKVICEAHEQAADLVFAIWGQQWPRLRRSFRFCTSSFADRSTESSRFDLQFTTLQERAFRARFTKVVDASQVRFETSVGWIDNAVSDIITGEGELRSFLKSVGGDIPGGREMFAPLSWLHAMLHNVETSSEAINEAVMLIDDTFDQSSAGLLRSILVPALAQHPGSLNGRSAEFLLKHSDLLNDFPRDRSVQALGEALWSLRPEEVLHQAGNDRQPNVVRQLLELLKVSDLVETAKMLPHLLPPMLSLRRDILNEQAIWTINGPWVRDVLKTSEPRTVLSQLLLADRADLAQLALEQFGNANVLQAVMAFAASMDDGWRTALVFMWLDVASRDAAAMAAVLNSGEVMEAKILLELAYRSYPDYVPNEVGLDPWATALNNLRGHLEEHQQQYLKGYLLARALGYRSHSQAELVKFSFDEIYFGALHERLANDAWRFVDNALPRSWWFDWDSCQRLRDAIVDVFVNRDLPAGCFAAITKDDSLFEELVRLASRNSRGKKYLKKVKRSLHQNEGSTKRIALIDREI